MNIHVNGKPWDLPAGSTLADVLTRLAAPPTGVAVALDGALVPRASWPGTALRSGAVIEVLTAVQGG